MIGNVFVTLLTSKRLLGQQAQQLAYRVQICVGYSCG